MRDLEKAGLQVMVGSTSSRTVTVPVHVPKFPLASVAVTVTREAMPTLTQENRDVKAAVGVPQLSFFEATI